MRDELAELLRQFEGLPCVDSVECSEAELEFDFQEKLGKLERENTKRLVARLSELYSGQLTAPGYQEARKIAKMLSERHF